MRSTISGCLISAAFSFLNHKKKKKRIYLALILNIKRMTHFHNNIVTLTRELSLEDFSKSSKIMKDSFLLSLADVLQYDIFIMVY